MLRRIVRKAQKPCVPDGTPSICRALRRDRASNARPYVHLQTSDCRKHLRMEALRLCDAAICCEMRNHVGAGIASPVGCMMLREHGARIVK